MVTSGKHQDAPKAPSSNHQAPEKLQTSKTNLFGFHVKWSTKCIVTPGKHQAPNFNRCLEVLRDRPACGSPKPAPDRGAPLDWSLGFGASLEFGVWSLM